jgi:MFS family permease
VIRKYRSVFRARGTSAFCAAAFVMRMPIAMYPIGIVLIISAQSGHYRFAGVLTAAYIAGGVPGNPILGRITDRLGQTRVILPVSAVHVAAVVTVAVLLTARVPDPVLLLPTFIAGFSYLSVGALVRARWSMVWADQPELATAYSLESTLDEVIFVVGPLIATLIATQFRPVLVLYLAAALVGLGALWLAAQPDTAPPAHPPTAEPHPSAIRVRGLVLLTVVGGFMGVVFASAEVAMIAFCGQHGQRGLSGPVVAAFALGSAVAGLFYGARSWATPLLARFRIQVLIFGVLPLVYLAATSVGGLALCSFVVGLGVAPTLILCFGLVEQQVPSLSLTEGFAWLLTGLNLGYGLGAAITGGIADAHGARVGFVVTIAAGLAMAATGLLLHRRLVGAP